MTLVEQIWKKLDDDMMALKQPAPDTNFVALKARLRAFAEVLAIFMNPHFTTADEIAREAVKRYDNRLDPEYCTPGLNQRRFEPPPGTNKYAPGTGGQALPNKSVAPRQSRYNPPSSLASKLKEEERAAIVLFHGNGFSVEQLAKTYGVSQAVIQAVLKG